MGENQNSSTILRCITGIINIGVHNRLPIIESRRVKMLNILALACIPFVILFLGINLFQDKDLLVVLNLANLISLLLLFFMHHYRLYLSAKLVRIALSVIIYTVSGIFYDNGTEYTLIGTLVISLLIFDNKWLITGLTIVIIGGILTVLNYDIPIPGAEQASPGRIQSVIVISLVFIIVAIIFFKRIQSDYQREIEAKQQKLVMMNHDKERLFSIVSHDIRGPLLSLEKILDMYQSGLLEKEDMTEATKSLHQKVSHLNNTIEVLLRWSALGMHGIQTKPDRFALIDLVNEVVHFFEFIAQQKNIIVNINVPESIMILADRDQLAVVLRNLVNNALKFSHIGHQVDISAESVEDGIGIDIRDVGVGMSEDARVRLFSVSPCISSGTNGERGAGLGLLLSKEFLTKNNGSIYVESAPGKGTCFRILFQQ